MSAPHDPAPRTPPVTTPGTATGQGDGIHVAQDGGVTIDPTAPDPTLQKEAADLNASGAYLVEQKGDTTMAAGLARVAAGYAAAHDQSKTPAQQQQGRQQMLSGVGTVLFQAIEELGGTQTAPVPAGATPAYANLPQAADAAANGVVAYPIETNNAHADPLFLRHGGVQLSNLLALNTKLTVAVARIGLTTVPLARQLSSTVSAVCLAVAPELARNLELQTTLGAALTYSSATSAKGQKTKAKNKAVKAKGGKETTGGKTTTPPAAGATPPAAGTAGSSAKGSVG